MSAAPAEPAQTPPSEATPAVAPAPAAAENAGTAAAASGEAAPLKKKKKKKKKKPKPPSLGEKIAAFMVKVKAKRDTLFENLKLVFFGVFDLASSLFSKDSETRKAAIVFFVSLGLSMSIVGVIWTRHAAEKQRVLDLKIAHLKALEERKKREERSRHLASAEPEAAHSFLLPLGRFYLNVITTNSSGTERYQKAELDLTLQLDSEATSEFFKAEQFKQAKDAITRELLPMKKEDFVSPAGRNALREKLRTALNLVIDPKEVIEDEKAKAVQEVIVTHSFAP